MSLFSQKPESPVTVEALQQQGLSELSSPKKFKLGISIGTKLVGLISVLLLSSVVSLVILATRLFIQDNTSLIQQMNADTAASISAQVREVFTNVNEKMRVVGMVLVQGTSATGHSIIQEVFSKDSDFLGTFVFHFPNGTDRGQILNKAMSPQMEAWGDQAGEKAWTSLQSNPDFNVALVAKGEVQVTTATLADGSPAVVLAMPFIENQGKFTHAIVGLIRQNRFAKIFGESDLVTSFMVDRKGRLLAHPDSARVAAAENVSSLGIVQQMLEGKFNNGQTRYVDGATQEARLGAFRLVGFGGLGTVAEVAEAKAFEAARRVEYRAMLLAVIVLSLSLLAGYFFSGTITWPIRQLVEASKKIAAGDFKISLKAKSRDEIGHLSLAFNDMALGLEERDRVKTTFNKFHNKEVAEKLLSGEVSLGGERIEATIFFSDVRGFTAMSESMQPEEVVVMLNEYMTRMVAIIRKHGGIVDKYVGDAIMALWGVPRPGEGGDDTYRAVRACLEMRADLYELNQLRLSRGQNELKIGMGLNCGPVIAGNIGSEEKMEYTVIGDSVNTASRMESMTKEYGTDLLVPKAIYEKVKDRFVFEKSKSAKVKGKTEALEVYQVKGYIDEAGSPVLIETPYSSYAAEKSDKVVHDESATVVGAQSAQEILGEEESRCVPDVPPLPNDAMLMAMMEEGLALEAMMNATPPPPTEEMLMSFVVPPPPTPEMLAEGEGVADPRFKGEVTAGWWRPAFKGGALRPEGGTAKKAETSGVATESVFELPVLEVVSNDESDGSSSSEKKAA